MIWFLITLLILSVVIPLIVLLYRPGSQNIWEQKKASLQFTKDQLRDLETSYKHNAISLQTYEQTKREFYKRFTNAASIPVKSLKKHASRFPVWIIIGAIPILSIALYLTNGHPTLPPEPLKRVVLESTAQNEKFETLIHKIKRVQNTFPNDMAVQKQGDILLGNLEMNQGHYNEAIEDFERVLHRSFDPQLAAQIGELMAFQDHHVSPRAFNMFQQALKASPPNAPWVKPLMARIAQGEHEADNP